MKRAMNERTNKAKTNHLCALSGRHWLVVLERPRWGVSSTWSSNHIMEIACNGNNNGDEALQELNRLFQRGMWYERILGRYYYRKVVEDWDDVAAATSDPRIHHENWKRIYGLTGCCKPSTTKREFISLTCCWLGAHDFFSNRFHHQVGGVHSQLWLAPDMLSKLLGGCLSTLGHAWLAFSMTCNKVLCGGCPQ